MRRLPPRRRHAATTGSIACVGAVLAASLALPAASAAERAAAGPPAAAVATTLAATPATPQSPAVPSAAAPLAPALQLYEGLTVGIAAGAAPTAGSSAASLGGARADKGRFVYDVFGWMLGAAGIASGAATAAEQQAQLNAISSQLTQVQSTLTSMQTQISDLSTAVAQLATDLQIDDCDLQTGQAYAALATVQAAQTDYSSYVLQTINASAGKAPVPALSELVGWANTWATPLQQALYDIADVLAGTGASAQAGAIQPCAQAIWTAWDAQPQAKKPAALLWEAGTASTPGFYADLYQYVGYWYSTQIELLNLYVEAAHLQAIQAAGTGAPATAATVQQVCGAAAAYQFCLDAAVYSDQARDLIAEQLSVAGAPYIWGSNGMVGSTPPGSGTPYAWLLDINDFQYDPAAGCAYPLTSTHGPCGPTASIHGTLPVGTWAWWDGWEPAPTAAWQDLIDTTAQPSITVAQLLQDAGLGDAAWAGSGLGNLVVYTGEGSNSSITFTYTPGISLSWEGLCMLDTNLTGNDSLIGLQGDTPAIWPLCDNHGGGLLAPSLCSSELGTTGSWFTEPALPYSDQTGFYDCEIYWPVHNSAQYEWVTQPGWAVNWGSQPAPSPPKPQYQWPVQPIAASACTNGMSVTNTTGQAWTMCGNDFQAWLAAQLPAFPLSIPPTSWSGVPVGTTAGTMVTVTNSDPFASVTLGPASVLGPPGRFAVAAGGTCPTQGTITLAAGQSCTVSLTTTAPSMPSITETGVLVMSGTYTSLTPAPAGTSSTTPILVSQQVTATSVPAPTPTPTPTTSPTATATPTASPTATPSSSPSPTPSTSTPTSVAVVSAAEGQPISYGGRFTVTATISGTRSGRSAGDARLAYLTLDGRATGEVAPDSSGLAVFRGIPARPGLYAVRFGGPGSTVVSRGFRLDVRAFGITRVERLDSDLRLTIATGTFHRGTPILLTRDGRVTHARLRVQAPGQPVTLRVPRAAGTYQVRVDTPEGAVYGSAPTRVGEDRP